MCQKHVEQLLQEELHSDTFPQEEQSVKRGKSVLLLATDF